MDDIPAWRGQRTELYLKDSMLCVEGEAAKGYTTYYALDPARPPLVLCSEGTVMALRYVPVENETFSEASPSPMEWVCDIQHYGGGFLTQMRDRVASVPVKMVVPVRDEETGEAYTAERLIYPSPTGILLQTGVQWILLVYQWTPVWDRKVADNAHEAALARYYGLDGDPGW